LEYLITYGWALVLVTAVVGVLVFIIGTPSSKVTFSSLDPTALSLRGGTRAGGTVTMALQNITGGKITITDFSGFGDACEINGIKTGTTNIELEAGEKFMIECNDVDDTDLLTPLSIHYKDFSGLGQEATIIANIPGGTTASLCGNGVLDNGEACDLSATPDGTGANMTCLSNCSANITDCDASLARAGNYVVQQNIDSDDFGLENCIVVTANDVSINCGGHTISSGTIDLGSIRYGISSTGQNAAISNCNLSGFDYAGINVSGCNSSLRNINISNGFYNGLEVYATDCGVELENVVSCDSAIGYWDMTISMNNCDLLLANNVVATEINASDPCKIKLNAALCP